MSDDARCVWRVRAFADHVDGAAWVYVVASSMPDALRFAKKLYGVVPLGAECERGPSIEDAWRARRRLPIFGRWKVPEWLKRK